MNRTLCFLLLLNSCLTGNASLEKAIALEPSVEVTAFKPPAEVRDSSLIVADGTTVSRRIQPPPGFVRTAYHPSTFAHYLQNFPLKADGQKVQLFNGREKSRQDVHAAILDIDVGVRDLQQCADAVMRLRAEYLWQAKRFDEISFHFTNGFAAPYHRWRSGERIRIAGNEVSWSARSGPSESYASFRRYMTMIFAYSSTISLAKEMHAKPITGIEAGDVFIQAGSPGHAVMVMDKAIHPETGEVLVLLAQSYMPAQDIHILKNIHRPDRSPWYSLADFDPNVKTPEWIFTKADLKAF